MMRFGVNLAGFANAMPAPDPANVIFVAGRMGNPAGGMYFTVRYMVLNECRTISMYAAKDPTADELQWFKDALSNLAQQQSFYTGEVDWQAQANMAFSQYQQWLLKVRES